jgi:hypothetical protein
MPNLNSGTPWTELADRDLRWHVDHDIPEEETADFLCRDLGEVRARKGELGLPQSTPRSNDRRGRLRLRTGKPWSEVDIQDLKEQVKMNATLEEASAFLRRVGDEFDVARKAVELGLRWRQGGRRRKPSGLAKGVKLPDE